MMLEASFEQASHDVICVHSLNDRSPQLCRLSDWSTLAASHVEAVLPCVVPCLVVEQSQEGARWGVYRRDGDVEGILFVPLFDRQRHIPELPYGGGRGIEGEILIN